MEKLIKTRIFVKSPVGEMASDWEERTEAEILELKEVIDMLMRGELAYFTLYSQKSTVYVPEQLAKNSAIFIQRT